MILYGQKSGTCGKPWIGPAAFEALAIDLRSGDIEIVGTDQPLVRVTCQMRDGDNPESVKISLAANHLRIMRTLHDVRIRIEVPEKTNLLIRASAGDMTVSGITGDKDVELRAGDLTIHVGAPELYGCRSFRMAGI